MNIHTIIVHPGRYHADDLLGISVVRTLFPSTKHVPIVRCKPTNRELENPKILVIDCGEKYDPQLNNFDHHQDKNICCASRLLWNYFYPESKALIKKSLDVMFFRSIDRHDRGHSPAITNSISVAVSTMNENNVTFEDALYFVETSFSSILKSAEKYIPVREYWYKGKSFGGSRYLRVFPEYCYKTIRDTFILFSRERKKSLYLIWPVSNNGGTEHMIYSAVETYGVPIDKRQIMNDGVSAVYKNKKDAIDHALELSVPLMEKRELLSKKRLKI